MRLVVDFGPPLTPLLIQCSSVPLPRQTTEAEGARRAEAAERVNAAREEKARVWAEAKVKEERARQDAAANKIEAAMRKRQQRAARAAELEVV